MRLAAMVVAVLTMAGLLQADVVHLTDGSTLEGIVRRSDDGWVVTANGKSTTVPADQVRSIEMKAAAGADARAAGERLASLRRAVQNSDNLADIITRYQRFISQNADPASTGDARKDLAVWQDRSDKQMTKVGGKWLAPQERAALSDTAAGLALQARDLLIHGKMTEAAPLLADAVADDPRSAAAQYLTGVLRYSQEAIPPARAAFEAALATEPDHAPTLNNLAVVLWRQRQFVAAMSDYDAAMLAARVNRAILDNVAAALASLPQEFHQSPVVARARLHFKEQDSLLQQTMARMGLRRSGATWIDDRQAAEMEQQRKVIQDKIDDLSAQYDRQQDVIHQIDPKILSLQASLHQIEVGSFIQDPKTGAMVAVPYPSVYYQMQQDVAALNADRQQAAAKLPPLQQQAIALRKQLPADAADAGMQRLFGPDAMPAPARPSTSPTTRVSS